MMGGMIIGYLGIDNEIAMGVLVGRGGEGGGRWKGFEMRCVSGRM